MDEKKVLLKRWLKVAFAALIALALCFAFMMPAGGAHAAGAVSSDSDVDNTASMATDVIYQIVTDRFFDGDPSNNPTGDIYDPNDPRKYHGGDWAGITQKLNANYFTDMGVTALWISSPVENIASVDPSNNSAAYHGYWAKDFYRTNQFFGSFQDFTTMVNTAHTKNIKIVIDFAPNHTSTAELGEMVFPEDGRLYRDGQLVSGFKSDTQNIFNHLGWTDYSTWENGIYHSLYGLADLNQMNNTVDSYLKDAIDKWLDLGVDGIRVDAVKHMPMGWQTNWLSSIYQHKPVFVFGEWFNGGTGTDNDMDFFANESGMSLLDFRYANAVRNAIGDRSMTMTQLHAVIEATEQEYVEVNDQVTFIDNHDMSRFMTLAGNKSARVDEAYVLMMTGRGVPTVYYGSEQYAAGGTDPYNRGDMPSFSKTSKAYQVISKLAPLRKSNPALAYGNTTERWVNDDVYIYERQFGDSVVVTAVNRSETTGYNITGWLSALPDGTYYDVLQNLMGGGNITVKDGAVTNPYYLGAGQAAVWQYNHGTGTTPIVGNVDPMLGVAGNTVTITGRGFGSAAGQVKFGTVSAAVVSWTDSCIRATVPTVAAGVYDIKVVNNAGVSSNVYGGYKVLSGPQTAVRFKVNNATTTFGTNVYLVGNVYELGAWDTTRAIGPMYNATPTIGEYPTWFFDVTVPANTVLEFKFIKKDAAGNVIWEGGTNHVYTTGSGTGQVVLNWTN